MLLTDLPPSVLDHIVSVALDCRDVRRIRSTCRSLRNVNDNVHAAQRTIVGAWTRYRATKALLDGEYDGDDALARLVATGADVNARDSNGWPPLRMACAMNKLSTIDILLAAGARVNARNGRPWKGSTALHTASMMGNMYAVEKLLVAGADVHARDEEGCTPVSYVHQYTRNGSSIKKILVEAGAHCAPARDPHQTRCCSVM